MHSALPLGIYLATKFWMYTTWFYWFWNDILFSCRMHKFDLTFCTHETTSGFLFALALSLVSWQLGRNFCTYCLVLALGNSAECVVLQLTGEDYLIC